MMPGESKGNKLAGTSNKKLFQLESESTVNHCKEDLSLACAGSYIVNSIDGDASSTKSFTNPSDLQIHRFDFENLKEQIGFAHLLVEEKAKLLETIQAQIQEKMETSRSYSLEYDYLRGEDRRARKLVRSKRKEIECLSSFVNIAKNALAVEDINSRIYNIEHMMQHGALPLMEEKQLLCEIKQLKLIRRQLSSNLGNQDETKLALDNIEQSEKHLKISRKELDVLKDILLNIEVAVVQSGKKFVDEKKKLKELQAQFRAVDNDHRASFAQWQRLNKELQNKVDNTTGDFQDTNEGNEGLDYEFSASSRVQSLDLNQEPSILPSHVHERVNIIVAAPPEFNSPSQTQSFDKQETTGRDDSDAVNEELKKSQQENTRSTTKLDEMVEMTKANDKAELKEQLRMEELTKANQAYERKKVQAKKTHMRDESKTQKEAEHKEKEREEKRLRRKKSKTAATADISDINKNRTAIEANKGISSVQHQKRVKPVPPPLRCHRNKKTYKQWIMWFGLMWLVCVVFWPGNIGDTFCINWQ